MNVHPIQLKRWWEFSWSRVSFQNQIADTALRFCFTNFKDIRLLAKVLVRVGQVGKTEEQL